MEFLVVWVIFCIVVGAIGSGRKIGFFGAFILSFLLSPLIGIAFTLSSKSKSDQVQENALREIAQRSGQPGSVADELVKLTDLLNQGIITQDEFDRQRAKLLS